MLLLLRGRVVAEEDCKGGSLLANMSSIGEGNSSSITFWQRLKKQKHGLGNMALAASTLVLALRLIDQDKEIERMRKGESTLLDALRLENRTLQDKFASFRAAVEEEIGRAGSR